MAPSGEASWRPRRPPRRPQLPPGPGRVRSGLLLATAVGQACVRACGASALQPPAKCLASAVPQRSGIRVKGQEVPVGFWAYSWPSAWLTTYVVQIVVEEVLGLQTNITGGSDYSADGLFALAGCTRPGEKAGCSEDPTFIHHVAMEVWHQDNFDKIGEALVRWPAVLPQNLGSIGYVGVEGMYVFMSERARAYDREGLALEYYRAYNASRERPHVYFDRHYIIDASLLLPCDQITLTNDFGNYLRVTGDEAGVMLNEHGQHISSCWNSSWWLSPACRDHPDTCVPVITSGGGWYIAEMMQKAFFFNMPLALASGVSTPAYLEVARTHSVLVYWYEPSTHFLEQSPQPIVFPSYDPEQRAEGILTSQSDQTWLGKGASAILESAAPSLQGLLSRVSFTKDQLLTMFYWAADAGCTDSSPECYKRIACSWVQEYGSTWAGWTRTVCRLGAGPLDEAGHFAAAAGEPKSGGCSICPAGCFSNLTAAPEAGYVCAQCPAGTSSREMGATACGQCPPGRFTEDPADASGACRSFGAPGSEPCRPCPAGYYSAAPGSTGCEACPAGSFQLSSGQTFCHQCPGGMVAEPGSTVCSACYVCLSNSLLIFELMATFVLLTGFFAMALQVVSAPPHFGYRIRIWDVQGRACNGVGTAIRCEGHYLHGGFPVKFSGTRVPALDCASASWRVRVSPSKEMELLDAQHRPVNDPALQTSMGFLHVPWRYALLRGKPRGVPLLLLMAWLLAAAAVLMLDADPYSPWADEFKRRGQPQAWKVRVAFAAFAAGACVLAAGWRVVRHLHGHQAAPLERSLQSFRMHLRSASPRPTPCERGAGRAVALRDLSDFFFHFQGLVKDRNMHYVVSNLVRSLTEEHRLSYAEVVGPKRVKWFVSHFWGTSFRGFVCSLQRHAEEVCNSNALGSEPSLETYWVCSFSNNQWQLAGELGGGAESSSFYVCMRSGSCRGTALVLDSQALPLTRSWCLFEMLQTMALRDTQPGFTGLWLCTETGTLNSGNASVELAVRICNAVSSLCLEDAEATRKEDKDMIDSEVASMPGGFESMNAFLRGNLEEALKHMKSAFDNEITASIQRLGASRKHARMKEVTSHLARRFSAGELPIHAIQIEG